MEQSQQKFNWSLPQRQPIAGLVIVFIKTIWEVLKRVWPLALLMIFNRKPGRTDQYEMIAAAIALFAIAGSIIKFIYFRFYISNDELVIKKGWINKQTIVIPLQRIQTVNIEENFLHSALNIVKVSIDTAGSNATEITIDALRKPMAEALQAQLYNKKESVEGQMDLPPAKIPVISLTVKDLWKLSFSANHMEAFFILLSFGFGIFDNLKEIGQDILPSAKGLLPSNSFSLVAFFTMAILIVTLFISTIRIFFKFYDFSLQKTFNGYHIRSGLTNVKEQMVAFKKIQFISWKANWIRKKIGLWLFEYHVTGGDDLKNKMRVQVPVTQKKYIPILTENYHPVPDDADNEFIRIDSSYITRRILYNGLIPALILMSATWWWWETRSLLFLIYPALVGLNAFLFQKKFALKPYAEILYLERGTFGLEKLLLKWFKLQSVLLKQSLFQQRKNLATLVLYTAAGTIHIPYISLAAARKIVNYGIYQVEFEDKPWM